MWPVYVAPEEMGAQCSIIGLRVLALRGKDSGSNMGGLEVYSQADCNNPVLSCKHDSIRCTGKMGRYIYVELGSRCKGGPGLLWMYFGSKEKANQMKDVLYMYVH